MVARTRPRAAAIPKKPRRLIGAVNGSLDSIIHRPVMLCLPIRLPECPPAPRALRRHQLVESQRGHSPLVPRARDSEPPRPLATTSSLRATTRRRTSASPFFHLVRLGDDTARRADLRSGACSKPVREAAAAPAWSTTCGSLPGAINAPKVNYGHSCWARRLRSSSAFRHVNGGTRRSGCMSNAAFASIFGR